MRIEKIKLWSSFLWPAGLLDYGAARKTRNQSTN